MNMNNLQTHIILSKFEEQIKTALESEFKFELNTIACREKLKHHMLELLSRINPNEELPHIEVSKDDNSKMLLTIYKGNQIITITNEDQ